MGYLEKAKNIIKETSNTISETIAEHEKQKLIKEKEEKKREIVKLSLEAEEFGISFTDYVQYLTYKELKENLSWIGDKVDEVHGEMMSSSSSLYELIEKKDNDWYS